MNRRHALVLTGGVLSTTLSGCLDALSDDGTDEDSTDDTGENGESTSVDDPPFTGTFTAVSQGGFISFNEDGGEDQAREDGVPMPAESEGDDPLELQGEIADDGTWESTEINFPPIEVEGLDVEIRFVDGLEGVLLESEGIMTLGGELEVLVAEETFSFDFEASTRTSGTMDGELALDSDPIRATLVDNEYTVEEETGSLIDNVLGLPADESGTNWFEVVLDVREG